MQILKRHKVDFGHDEPITHLATGRNQVVVATKDKRVLIIDTTTSKQTDCDLARYLGNRLVQAKIYRIFVDPSGEFILISLAFASDNQPLENLLYVKRLQPLSKLKNHLINAVAWNFPKVNTETNDSNSTGTVLLGTSKGLILQTELTHTDDSKFFPLGSGSRQYVREVFDVGQELGAITGLEFHRIPSSNQTEKSYIIMISTKSRLYRMVGSVPANVDPPPLHLIIAQNSTNYQDVPGRFNNSKLDFHYQGPNLPPTRFAWLTEPGVITGELHNQLSACRTSFEYNDDMTTIPYTSYHLRDDDQFPLSATPSSFSPSMSPISSYYQDKPISAVVTNFHVVVLFRHSIKVICILNEAVTYEEHFSIKYGAVVGMSKEPVRNLIWVYCERAILRYKMSNESKNVWKIYLEQRNFELARKYSSGDETSYDRVICEEAQHYFNLKDYDKSAELFAKSKRPFEDVAILFMQAKCQKALRKYLSIKLDTFDPSDSIQLTMTLAWLMELIIGSLDQANSEELYQDLEKLMDSKQVVNIIKRQPKLFYGIIRNHSDLKTFVMIAKSLGDYELVIQHHMDLGELDKALDVMKDMKNDELFYTYGHILMKKLPREFVDALMERPNIQPQKLLPILMQENPYYNKCSETIRYLEFCINQLKCESQVLHHYLFELYARHRDEETLLRYLEQETQIESDITSIGGKPATCYLDLQLCLRLCSELKLLRTCVNLYSIMGLFDEAVNLALDFDLNLAKEIARRATESEDHQKRLWLLIAQTVLASNPDIMEATSLLNESRMLKIEDILPFFPNYTTIDFFKAAIRKSLQEYRDQIMMLKDGTYDTMAEEIRTEIKTFRNRYSIIKTGQRCEICSRALMSRAFHVFPCGHLFHTDCIVREILSVDPEFQGDLSEIGVGNECVYCGGLFPSYINKGPPAAILDSQSSSVFK